MSETRNKMNLDAVLKAWPEREKSAVEWEEMARSVEARLQTAEPSASAANVSDENLFADPLGQSEEDGHNHAAPGTPISKVTGTRAEGFPMSMPADRERDRRSLQDLAKMANMTPPPPSVSAPSGVHRAAEAKDDSGIVDLAAAAAADPGAEVRAQSTPLASQGLFDDEPLSIRPPPASLSQPVPSIPPMPVSMAPGSMPASMPVASGVASSQNLAHAPASAPAVYAAPSKKGNGAVIALVFGGLVAASAAAAGVFFVMKHKTPAPAPVAVVDAPAAQKPATATPATPDTTAAVASNDTAPPDTNTDPNALPGAKAKPGALAAKPGAMAATTPAAPKEDGPAKLTEKDLAAQKTGAAGGLGDAIANSVGPGEKGEQTPAAGSTGPQFAAGTVPQKPSQGAVTGALGSVLPGARACLGPDDPVSYASITFGSGGSVQSVSVSGGAAGKPAESCIKGALGKAKIAAFAEPTYTARITVRH